MAAKRGKILTFKRFLWICAGLITIWLLVVPLVFNEWARRTWKEVPCHLNAPGGAYREFYYEVEGQRYFSTRQDFWDALYFSEKRRNLGSLVWNDTCWISPSDPERAVLRLDALNNWSEAASRVGITVLLLAVVSGMTWFGGKRKSQT